MVTLENEYLLHQTVKYSHSTNSIMFVLIYKKTFRQKLLVEMIWKRICISIKTITFFSFRYVNI